MKTRIITAAAALALFVVVLLFPPIVFTIALAAVIFFMLFECYRATKADMAMKVVGFISAAIMIGAALFGWILAGMGEPSPLFTGIFVVAAIAFCILLYMALVVKEHGKTDYKEVLASGFLTVYIVLSMGSIWFAKELYSTKMMLFIFVCAWSTDTFAYFSGRFFGKHKLIPHVSPNKTVEGSIGGIIGAAVACFVYARLSGQILRSDIIFSIVYGVIGGALSQLGDLAASAIKRDTGIKDFGWIFPGHGGFMDRFDSVMYIAPVLHIVVLLGIFLV